MSVRLGAISAFRAGLEIEAHDDEMVALLTAGLAAAVLHETCEPTDCMGKRKKKDSVQDDEMYAH